MPPCFRKAKETSGYVTGLASIPDGGVPSVSLRLQLEFLYRLAADQMFIDDSIEHFRSARVIPDALRIDDGHRAGDADSKAVGLRAKDEGAFQSKLAKPAFQVLPRTGADGGVAALGFGGSGTKEDVAP